MAYRTIGKALPRIGGQSDSVKNRKAHGAKEQRVRNGRKLMTKNVVRLALSAMLFALCGSVDAQQPGKILRIGSNNPQSLLQFDIPMDRR